MGLAWETKLHLVVSPSFGPDWTISEIDFIEHCVFYGFLWKLCSWIQRLAQILHNIVFESQHKSDRVVSLKFHQQDVYCWRTLVMDYTTFNLKSTIDWISNMQMLLCVGSFFNNTPECQQQWKEYVEGREKGKEKLFQSLVPIELNLPLLKHLRDLRQCTTAILEAGNECWYYATNLSDKGPTCSMTQKLAHFARAHEMIPFST